MISIPGCACCGLNASTRRLYALVDALQVCFPDLEVRSGTRCEKHNSSPQVGGSPRSGHLPIWGGGGTESVAVDVTLREWTRQRARALAFAAVRAGAKGIGYYPWGLHIDLKPRFQLWKWNEGALEYFF